MKLFVVLALVAISAAAVDYEHVLQSPGELKALFSEFSSKFGKVYSAAEAPLRIRLFRSDLKRVVQVRTCLHRTLTLSQILSFMQSITRLLCKVINLIIPHQLNKDTTWTSGLNQFSAMTAEEKLQHLGVNMTLVEPRDVEEVINAAPS